MSDYRMLKEEDISLIEEYRDRPVVSKLLRQFDGSMEDLLQDFDKSLAALDGDVIEHYSKGPDGIFHLFQFFYHIPSGDMPEDAGVSYEGNMPPDELLYGESPDDEPDDAPPLFRSREDEESLGEVVNFGVADNAGMPDGEDGEDEKTKWKAPVPRMSDAFSCPESKRVYPREEIFVEYAGRYVFRRMDVLGAVHEELVAEDGTREDGSLILLRGGDNLAAKGSDLYEFVREMLRARPMK